MVVNHNICKAFNMRLGPVLGPLQQLLSESIVCYDTLFVITRFQQNFVNHGHVTTEHCKCGPVAQCPKYSHMTLCVHSTLELWNLVASSFRGSIVTSSSCKSTTYIPH